MNSYPKIYNVGHPALDGFFDGHVVIEEKVDGSQFSFCREGGVLEFKSKRATIHPEAPGMFEPAVRHLESLDVDRFIGGVTYRCEFLSKPKHNVLTYGRVPNGHLVLFDITTGEERYANRRVMEREAEHLGIDVVPVLFTGKINSPADVEQLLNMESFLGGPKVEGLVFKRHRHAPLFGPDAKALIAKYVSESFRESHKVKRYKTPKAEVVEGIVAEHRTEARWQKAVQHLREAGELEGEPRDIGRLIKEVQQDLIAECADDIRAALFQHFIPQVQRGVIRGLAEWYKEQLLQQQFERPEEPRQHDSIAPELGVDRPLDM